MVTLAQRNQLTTRTRVSCDLKPPAGYTVVASVRSGVTSLELYSSLDLSRHSSAAESMVILQCWV